MKVTGKCPNTAAYLFPTVTIFKASLETFQDEPNPQKNTLCATADLGD